MEPRQLLTGSAFGISGPAATDEGAAYVLNLAASGPGASTIDHWTINWGDGNTQNVPGSPASVSHVFADGVRDHTVTATVTNADGTFPARNGPAVNEGDLDPSFGPSGSGKLSATGISYTAAAGLAGGKFLVAGSNYVASSGQQTNFWLCRFNADGTPDTTFGTNGSGAVTADFSNRSDYGSAVLVQPDGKVVVGGRSLNPVGAGSDFALARFNADGTLDDGGAADTTPGDSFGTAGRVRRHVGEYATNDLTALALQSDGRIVAAGNADRDGNMSFYRFALARFTAGGAVDTTFAGGGSVETDLPDPYGVDRAYGLAIQGDDKILLAGETAGPLRAGNWAAARYNADGSLDTTFGSSGFYVSNLLTGGAAYAVAVQSDGSIVLGGRKTLVTGPAGDSGLIRLTASGAVDTGFGGSGTGLVSMVLGALNASSVRALSIDSAGRIVAAGKAFVSTIDFGLARYGADGALDATFGDAGKVITDVGGINNHIGNTYFDGVGGLAVMPDGNVLLVGGDSSNSYMARFNGSPPAKTVHVNNVAPTLTLSGAAGADEGSPYTLQLSGGDPGSDTLSRWVINWGDGTAQQTVTGNPPSVTHVFADGPNTFSVSATAVDEDGSYAAAGKSVSVTNVAPTVSLTGAAAVGQGAAYTLGFSASDPGADAVSQWAVDWGDGSQGTYAGTVSSAQHTYAAPGSYTIAVSPTDEDGSYAGTTKVLTATEPDRALGRPATASSYDPTPLADYRPSSAVDGNSLTRWSANAGGTQWVRVDLGATYNLSRVKLKWEGAYASAYKIQVSDDQVTWRDAASVTGGNGADDDLTKADGLSGNGRYVQVLCTTAPYGNYSLWDFEVYGGQDLARNRPTTASGYDPSTVIDYRPLSSTDGISSTRWSANGGGTQWVRVDLGAPYRLSRVKLNWEGAYASAYKIQVSNDAVAWRDGFSTSSGDGGLDDLTGVTGSGRYVQVLCTTAPYGNYSLWDFEVYGGSNLALKTAASASQYDPSTAVDYRPSSAFDGNDSTRWSANGGGIQWLRADLGASFKLTRAKLNWEGAYGSAYRIQVSDDQVTWRDAATVTGGNGADDDVVLSNNANSTGRYVQVLMTTAPYGNYSLWGVEVFAG